jgi:CheY-like chemotaxis protein
MPRLDGRGFLEQLRKFDEFRALPVVVLTSSDAEQDVVRATSLEPTAT